MKYGKAHFYQMAVTFGIIGVERHKVNKTLPAAYRAAKTYFAWPGRPGKKSVCVRVCLWPLLQVLGR